MGKWSKSEFLTAFTRMCRRVVLEEHNITSCIASVSIAIVALRYFKIDAQPLVVEAHVFNPALTKWLEEHNGNWPTTDEEKAESLKQGAFMITIGDRNMHQPLKGFWPGHLVVLSREHKFLMDPSIDQGDRPHKNLKLEPCWVSLTAKPEFPFKDDLISFEDENLKQRLIYKAYVTDKSYKLSPDWLNPARQEQSVAKLIKRVETAENLR